MAFDGLIAAQIVRDVAAGIPPNRSKIKYDREALQFRKEVEREWKHQKATNPKARLEVPNDIDGL